MIIRWKPKDVKVTGAPIPLYYDYEEFPEPKHPLTKELYPILYYGFRPKDSLIMHWEFNRPAEGSYPFKFPPNLPMVESTSFGWNEWYFSSPNV
jgi:hypothetical protein